MIQRFPREEALQHGSNKYSMNDVWDTVERIAKGKTVSPKARVLVQRWFGLPHMTQEFALQCLRPDFDGNFRMPREAKPSIQLRLYED